MQHQDRVFMAEHRSPRAASPPANAVVSSRTSAEGASLHELLDRSFAGARDRCAIEWCGRQASYAELDAAAAALTGRLAEGGVSRRSIVAVALENRFDLV